MNWFKNRSITAKLVGSFVVVAFVAGVVGLVGIRNIRTINNADTMLYETITLPLQDLGELSTAYQEVQVVLRDIVMATDDRERNQFAGTIPALTRTISTLAARTDSAATSPELRRAYEAFAASRTAFLPVRDRVIQLARAGRSAEATRLLQGDARDRTADVLVALDSLRVIKARDAKATSEGNTAIANRAVATMVAFIVGGALLAIGLGLFVARLIARPIGRTVDVLEKLAEGDLTQRLAVDTTDEVGRMGTALNRAIESMRDAMTAIRQNATTLASSSEELSAVSTQMGSNAEETAAQSNVVSAAAEQVSTNIQTVATGAEEMSASIKEIAKNASAAAKVASTAVVVADQTNSTISKLGESSAEIGNVLKVITSIAEQTNLLALNATIEAARAGEAGKGFAVVANEVKELAKETARATEDISRKIQAIQADTQGAVAAIGEITSVIRQINDISGSIASAVEEQAGTTNEIVRNVAEAAKGSGEIAQNITGVATAAQSTTSGAQDSRTAAAELAKMAAELQALVARFRIETGGIATPVVARVPASAKPLGPRLERAA
jgi:methyl-accepting chemotaxis protein